MDPCWASWRPCCIDDSTPGGRPSPCEELKRHYLAVKSSYSDLVILNGFRRMASG